GVRSGQLLNHDHLRADLHPGVQIDDILVAHADAAGRDLRTDGPRLVGTMDAIKRRAEVQRTRSERIVRTALHVPRQIRPAPQHFLRRRPIRPLAFVRDVVNACPGEARAPHADAVTYGASTALHEVEQSLAGIDDDGARRLLAVIAHVLADIARVYDEMAR